MHKSLCLIASKFDIMNPPSFQWYNFAPLEPICVGVVRGVVNNMVFFRVQKRL